MCTCCHEHVGKQKKVLLENSELLMTQKSSTTAESMEGTKLPENFLRQFLSPFNFASVVSSWKRKKRKKRKTNTLK
jgi:hypothetical protein